MRELGGYQSKKQQARGKTAIKSRKGGKDLSSGAKYGELSDHNGFFDNEIMNVKQAAQFLRVSDKTVYEKSKTGIIPHQRIGSKYIFLRSELVRFLKGE